LREVKKKSKRENKKQEKDKKDLRYRETSCSKRRLKKDSQRFRIIIRIKRKRLKLVIKKRRRKIKE